MSIKDDNIKALLEQFDGGEIMLSTFTDNQQGPEPQHSKQQHPCYVVILGVLERELERLSLPDMLERWNKGEHVQDPAHSWVISCSMEDTYQIEDGVKTVREQWLDDHRSGVKGEALSIPLMAAIVVVAGGWNITDDGALPGNSFVTTLDIFGKVETDLWRLEVGKDCHPEKNTHYHASHYNWDALPDHLKEAARAEIDKMNVSGRGMLRKVWDS